jgi:hypothetical protein
MLYIVHLQSFIIFLLKMSGHQHTMTNIVHPMSMSLSNPKDLTSHLQKSNSALKHFVTKFVTWAIDSRTHWSGRSIYRGSMLDDADEMK